MKILNGIGVKRMFLPTRPQDPIVLVLSEAVLVIERFACMASTRLPLRPTNRRSPTRGSCSLSRLAYPLPNSSKSTSTSTKKNSPNKTMHRSGRSAALIFRNHFGGHSEMVAARAWQRMLIEEAGVLANGVDTRRRVDSFSQVHRIAFESC